MRNLFGLHASYTWFVPEFTAVAAPLHQLTRKGAHFLWGVVCQRAFEVVKQSLVDVPALCCLILTQDYLTCRTPMLVLKVYMLSFIGYERKEWVVAYFST